MHYLLTVLVTFLMLLVHVIFGDLSSIAGLSLRAGGQGFSLASMNLTPAYFSRKIE